MSDIRSHDTESSSIAELQARIKVLAENNQQLVLACKYLSQHETDLLAMVEVLDAMVWSVDDQLNFKTLNEQARKRMNELHGMAPQVGDMVHDVLKNLDIAAVEFWKSNYAKALEGERFSFLYELELPTAPSHSPSYSYNSFNPITVNGKVVGVSCLAQDITERVKTSRILEASEKRFRALTEHGNDMLTIRNAEGDVLYDSPSKARILGFQDGEEVKSASFDFVHKDDRATLNAAFALAIASPGKPIYQHCRVVRKDGSIMQVMGHVTNMLDVPEVAGVVSNMQDITELHEASERLRISDALMAEAQRLAHIGSWELEFDPSGRRSINSQRWSDEKFRILGLEPGEIEPSVANFLKAVHPEDRNRSKKIMLVAIRDMRSVSIDIRIIRPDGTVRWVVQEAFIINDAQVQGRKRIVGTLQDITTRKIAEDELRFSEERFRALIEGSADGILLTDANCTISYIAPSIFAMLGFTPQEMLGRSAAEFLMADQRPMLAAIYERILAAPGASERNLFQLAHKDGRVRWISTLFTNMVDVPAVGAVVFNYKDITERVELHETMVFDHSNLAALINSTSDPIWSVDADYRLITGNDAFLDSLQQVYSHRFAPGESLLLPDTAGVPMTSEWYAHFMEAMQGKTVSVERHFTNPAEAWVEFHYSPIRQNDVVMGVACFSRNITEHRLAQRAAEESLSNVAASEREKTIILDALPSNVALLDGAGSIVAVNAAWREFARGNAYEGDDLGVGRNYVDVSRSAAGIEAEMGKAAADGLQQVLSGRSQMFSMEYPCDSSEVKRWFRMQASALSNSDNTGAVVMHVDITERVLAQEEVLRWNTLLEDRVIERTEELQQVNEHLDAETVKNKELSDVVNARNLELMSSISYASYIQRSLMPGKDRFDFFRDMALFSHPRDVLSGDFLWCHNTPEHLILAVADCTGHGVPGAMMSMLGHELLNSIVRGKGQIHPEHILTKLDHAIERIFQQSKDFDVTDGMDIALVVVEKDTLKLSFAGALLPALIIRDGQPILLRASKATIGGHLSVTNKIFVRHDIQLLADDRICLFTDGYGDQFGGPRNKKLLRRPFTDLLISLSPLSAPEAVAALGRHFSGWKGDKDQVDDVMVLLLDV